MLSLSSVFSWSFSWKVFLAKAWKWILTLVLTCLLFSFLSIIFFFFFYSVLFYFKKVPNVWCSYTPITSSALLAVSAAFALLLCSPHLIQRSEMSWESANQMSRHVRSQKIANIINAIMVLHNASVAFDHSLVSCNIFILQKWHHPMVLDKA